jgi:hypothetical protein
MISTMKIVYYTSGISGSGRIVTGISIGNAFRRKGMDVDFTILSSSPFAALADDYNHEEIPLEDEFSLSADRCRSSALYSTLERLQPDILLVDLQWYPLHHFIIELPCKKILLCRQVDDRFFSLPLHDGPLEFERSRFDLVLATEPFESIIPMTRINPIVIRNRDEILSRHEALKRLGLDEARPNCLFAFNGHPDDFRRTRKKYSYLEDSYRMVYSTNYREGLFPAADYFNAFDFIVCGGGYNQFWEVIYFDKEAVFEPTATVFEDQARRIRECQEYYFDENGADQLVALILGM